MDERPGIAAGDLNGDGLGELILNSTRGLLVYRGTTQGVNPQPVTYPYVVGRPFIVDWDKDGRPDVVVIGASTVLYRGNGDGTLQAPRVLAPGGFLFADLNGDGFLDVIDPAFPRIRVYLGESGGTVRQIPVESTLPPLEGSIGFADINGDRRLDFVYRATRTRAGWMLGDGEGRFSGPTQFETGSVVSELFFADVNGDGRADLICNDFVQPDPANPAFAADRILVFLAAAAGGFLPPAVLARNLYLYDVIDLNGDGTPDLLAHDSMFFGVGDGSFVRSTTFAPYAGVSAHRVARMNGDPFPDVVAQISTPSANRMVVFPNSAQPSRISLRGPAGEGAALLPAGVPAALSISVAGVSGTPIAAGRVVLRNNLSVLATLDLDRASPAWSFTPAAGVQTLTASYVGPLPFGPATSAPLTVIGGDVATNTELRASPERPSAGQAVELVATVRAQYPVTLPGAVEFRQGSRVLGLVPLQSGVARLTLDRLEPGVQVFRAIYQGGVQILPSEAALEISARGNLAVVSAGAAQSLLAGDAIASAYGAGIGPAALAVATLFPLPLELASRRVRVRDAAGVERFAGLYFVSADQINFVVPAGSSLGNATVAVLDSSGAVLGEGSATIGPTAPALFLAPGGRYLAAYTVTARPDGTRTTAFTHSCDAQGVCTPVPIDVTAGDVVLVLFGTGLRGERNPRIRIGEVDSPPAFAGPQGEYPGLDQVNVSLPAALAGRGDVPVSVVTGFLSSGSGFVRIR